ncbi:VOC family protein [Tepidicaulis sp.]|uniref:VOC family protein n=1 Tax=Tepidicaulis sp. TaxID=1920809 RepID=UPI003B5D0122
MLSENPVEVTAMDHLYLSVSDIERSMRFYDTVFGILDFRRGDMKIAGAPHYHYFNKVMQISIRPASPHAPAHDPYQPGLHHLCLQVKDEAALKEAWHQLKAAGIEASEPAYHTDYAPDYYATFFSDPDGLRLELVARRAQRERIEAEWARLTRFENPFGALD